MLSRFRHWSQHLTARLSAVVSSSCALCGSDSNDTICSGCRSQFFGRLQHRCLQCAIPLPGMTAMSANKCGDCLQQPPRFDATFAATDYVPPIDRLVLALKFGNQLALAPLFARLLRDALPAAPDLALPLILTAVPLGEKRLAERGFNQALEIAKPLSLALGIQFDARLLLRVRETHAQALLHPAQRHQNIRHAFIVSQDAVERVRGRHIGVVDDVLTTGETLNELAATLKRFGAARVTNFVFARTPHK
jgi:ComF family protein